MPMSRSTRNVRGEERRASEYLTYYSSFSRNIDPFTELSDAYWHSYAGCQGQFDLRLVNQCLSNTADLLCFLANHGAVLMSSMSLPVLLVVEDVPLILLEVEDTLKEGGFETVAAVDARSAMAEIDADCARFSGLITDVDLGDGPTGWEISRHARKLCPNLPVVYMSGASHSEWAAEGVPKSIMLVKPFAPAQLVTAISMLLNEAPPNEHPV